MRFFLWCFVIVFAFSSCSEQSESKEEALNEIRERELGFATSNMNFSIPTDSIREVVALYVDFANNFPEDSLAPEYLFKAAEIQKNYLREYDEAIYLLEQAYEKYTDHPRAPIWCERSGELHPR